MILRILYLNPNSTQAMTDSMVASARAVLPQAEIMGWTNTDGPPAIQGAADGAAAVPGLLAMLPRAREAGAEVLVIGCFDDTGLEELRAAAHCPVIGIGQSAYHMATLRGARFSVLTTLPVSVPVIQDNIRAQGFAGVCDTVHPSGISVLEVEDGTPPVMEKLAADLASLARLGTGAVVLGCAGMSAHLHALQATATVPLIDGVRAAAGLAAALVVTRA